MTSSVIMDDGDAEAGSDPLRWLLSASHHLPADHMGTAVADAGRMLGARDAVLYLSDYAQHQLLPVTGERVPAREPLDIDGSTAGAAFRRVEVTRSPGEEGTVRLWLPLLDGAERLGVVELVVDEHDSGQVDEPRALASLLSELTVTRDAYSDVFARLRRRQPLSLAAEIQWDLLPPLTFATDRVVITGVLEPTYEIGGDTFDYAADSTSVDLMVLDAVGHGLPAALLAAAAVGAYRNGRRSGMDLPQISLLMSDVIAQQFPDSRFATAALARLDLDTGVFRWVNAGHPAPVIVRDHALVFPARCRPALPLGLQATRPEVCQVQLSPGDRVVLYTDGVVEARSPDGEFFGEERLAQFIVRAELAGDPPPETMRRLIRSVMDHQADHLQDDASIVLVEWRTGREDQLQV
jgi:hypothetical protein